MKVTLDDLALRYALSPGAADQLSRLAETLATDPTAPTTVRDPQRVREDHLADSLVALELAEVREARAVADLGAGAGLPGLPLAIARPTARVVLVESNARKCDFITRAIAVAGIANASAVAERAESWDAGFGQFDLVTARALAPLGVVIEYAAPLLRVGGSLVVWRGQREPRVEAEAEQAADVLGLTVDRPLRVQPYPQVEHRYLHVVRKVSKTPDGFPRRPGIARKRPLGSRPTPSDRSRR